MEIPKNFPEFQAMTVRCWKSSAAAARYYAPKALASCQRCRPVLSGLGNKALTGVVVAIPLLATIWVVQFAYSSINDLSAPALKEFGIHLPLVPFFVTLGVFIALGFMTSNVFGRRILESLEAALLKVPVVATVYTAVKQVIDSFKSFKNMENFKRVVYLDYPAEGARLIGFVTGQYYDAKLGEEMTTVVIPTAPNPMTGLVVAVPASKLTESSLTLEEAMKMVVSAGLVAPKRRLADAVAAPLSKV
ncbi:MAG: DUF502 domain-containing protein [Chthoniobacteraceae bacterium]|nr:DUF502 domain-containing protein [Chthoniobacteraceae bacterium]